MSHFIEIEHAKNMRAARRIAFIALAFTLIIMALVLWRCWHDDSRPASLLEFMEITTPGLVWLASRTSSTKNSKWPIQQGKRNKDKGTTPHKIKYDFHLY